MADKAPILARFNSVRLDTYAICAPLRTEDYVVQPTPDVSPPRWHIGHTTWFLEQFLLGRFEREYQPYHPQYAFLFNSYYNLVGERTERPRRGLLTRPTVAELWAYREEVDARMRRLIETCIEPAFLPLLETALHHEQQHQELLLTDIKHILFQEPLFPAYATDGLASGVGSLESRSADRGWTRFEGGTVDIGHDGNGFAFDNEGPQHKQLLRPFRLANDLVRNADYLEFMQAGGYTRPELWLSDGWDIVQQRGWGAPFYWVARDDGWHTFTLRGLRPLGANDPVVHVSYYEADAFARWAGKRLPTEFEWEHAANQSGAAHEPAFAKASAGKLRHVGEVWEWTGSAYVPYPGYRAPEGAIGEYNGKFMVNQMVLRGSSYATPRGHSRPTYRNFWHPEKRWQFSGIRLAEDA